MTQVKRKYLFKKAERAAKDSYSPYSKFPVGAYIVTKSGYAFYGANVENASYGLTICAERVAICNTVSAGHRDIAAIAVCCIKGDGAPCGACRQFILEFGKDIEVIYRYNRKIVSKKAIDLIPDGFTPEDL